MFSMYTFVELFYVWTYTYIYILTATHDPGRPATEVLEAFLTSRVDIYVCMFVYNCIYIHILVYKLSM